MKVVRHVGRNACSQAEYREALASTGTAVIDTLSNGANTTVRFELDGKPLHVRPSEPVRDFLDLATLVYIADELCPRLDSTDRWTRLFDVLFPVTDPSVWANASPHLERSLKVLAGDVFRFAWPRRSAMPAMSKHRKRPPANCDVICLFSGGLDSLLGAYSELRNKKRVLLLGHQADPTTAAAQTELAKALNQLFPGMVRLIQSRVARSLATKTRFQLPDKCEIEHRPRSFLFLGLAVAIASVTRTNQIRLPENGLIALNSPLQLSRLGTLSTRTAHPLFVSCFLQAVRTLGIFNGEIVNPFLFLSKTDLASFIDKRIAPLAVRSVSCAHVGSVRWSGKKDLRHCGYCVPCIYRRLTLLEAKLDSPVHYDVDVFTNLAGQTPKKQADLRALAQFAKRILDANTTEREAMVIAHGYFPPSVAAEIGQKRADNYSPWADMLLRWASDFFDKLQAVASTRTKSVLGLATRGKRP